MKVAVDAQLTVGTATGIGEYVRGLIVALRAQGTDVAELLEPELDPWRFDRRVLWDQVHLPQRARAEGADVLHCASGTMPLRFERPIVVTVHDVAWLRVQAHTRPYARYYFGALALHLSRRATRIAVDSNFSRGELLELIDGYDPEHVAVVYPGVAGDYCALERRRGDTRTILAVGTIERRKNLELIVRALPSLPGARLVAVGPQTPYQRECEDLAVELGVRDRVQFAGYVEREALLELYATCAVVAVPSRYEGFGYAAAQALCVGTPCVVSDQSALPEVVSNDAPAVPLDDLDAWVNALTSALRGERDIAAARAREAARERFAWPASARRMQEVYRASVDG